MIDNDKIRRTIDSPIGPLLLAGREDGTLTNLAMDGQAHPPKGADGWPVDEDSFKDIVDQLDAYFAGELTTFDVRLEPEGTPFQQKVWARLRAIPYGETRSYGQLAADIGQPKASRAVGLANGRNPIAIIVPCHRVIGANGTLTGFGGGLHRKQALLDLERGIRGSAASS